MAATQDNIAALISTGQFGTNPDMDTLDNWAPMQMPTSSDGVPPVTLVPPVDQSILDELSLLESISSAPSNAAPAGSATTTSTTAPSSAAAAAPTTTSFPPPPPPPHNSGPNTMPLLGIDTSAIGASFNPMSGPSSGRTVPHLSSPVTPTCSGSQSGLPSPRKRRASASGLSSTSAIAPPHAKRRTILSNFGAAVPKTEPVMEPLTPSSSHRALLPLGMNHQQHPNPAPSHNMNSNMSVAPNSALPPHPPALPLLNDNAPMAFNVLPASSGAPSSACNSISSDEAAATTAANMPVSPTAGLPAPSAEAAKKRRMARSRVLAASRARASAKAEPLVPGGVAGAGGAGSSVVSAVGAGASPSGLGPGSADDDAEPVDKKVARAIRNRQAAQRSRVEAKQKMAKLADANGVLATEVEKLTAENAALNKQLEELMQATFGSDAQIGEVLEMFRAAKEGRSGAPGAGAA